MRDIKFRVWDKSENKFLRHGSDCRVEATTGQVIHTYCPLGHNFIDCGHLELQQYTGITDKLGVEIYEDDICLVGDGGEYFGRDWPDEGAPIDTDKFVIVWDERSAAFYIKDLQGKDPELEWTPFGYANFEVIGNIYESPELLEASK